MAAYQKPGYENPWEIGCVDQYIYQHKEKEVSMVSSSNTISDPVAMTLIIIAE